MALCLMLPKVPRIRQLSVTGPSGAEAALVQRHGAFRYCLRRPQGVGSFSLGQRHHAAYSDFTGGLKTCRARAALGQLPSRCNAASDGGDTLPPASN